MSESTSSPTQDEIELFQETVAAAQAGDLPKAYFLAGGALHLGLRHPLFYKLRGLEHEQFGRLTEAEADFRAALADAPADPATHDMLGRCLAAQGRLTEALSVLRQALELKPDHAPAFLNRALVLEGLGDLRGAAAAYRQALEHAPELGRAQSGLALLAARTGRWAEARERANQALHLAADDPGARLALAMAALGEGETAQAQVLATALAEDVALHPQQRAAAGSVLGDALDAQDRTAEAFAAYQAANEVQRTFYGPAVSAVPETRGIQVAERLARSFADVDASVWAQRTPAGPAPAAGHAFLLGFPRSGTTLVGQMLAAHPQVVTLDEMETLAAPGAPWLDREDGWAQFATAGQDQLEAARDRYWRGVTSLGIDPAGRVFVDKLPMNTLGLPLIARLFPDARVVFMRRDPRDVVLSCFRRQFVMNGTNWEFLELETAARLYDAVMRLADAYLAALPLETRILRHEDLAADPAAEAGGLLGFLGLAPETAVTAFAGASDPAVTATPSAAQIRRGVSAEGVGQWRRYADELAPVIPILEPWIERFGYGG